MSNEKWATFPVSSQAAPEHQNHCNSGVYFGRCRLWSLRAMHVQSTFSAASNGPIVLREEETN